MQLHEAQGDQQAEPSAEWPTHKNTPPSVSVKLMNDPDWHR
ncbi:Unknown protein sequence [Pseudomonas amygdali pv. lachrymans]|nr:Unknown protein sequence [Pseudomonas amygdali pv. lachrymans]